MSIKFGSDVEAFLYDTNTNRTVPACGLLGGTKNKPLDISNGFAVQEDNVMVEFNIPPADTPLGWATNLAAGRARVQQWVKDNVNERYDLLFRNAVQFSLGNLESRQAQTFGCLPELSAYGRGDRYPAPNLARDHRLRRFAGLHIHLGFSSDALNIPHWVAASLFDAFLMDSAGGGSAPYFESPVDGAAARLRRSYYGKPGAYRETRYSTEYPRGLEYRCFGAADIEDRDVIARNITEFLPLYEECCKNVDVASEIFQALDFSTVQERRYNESNYRIIHQKLMGVAQYEQAV